MFLKPHACNYTAGLMPFTSNERFVIIIVCFMLFISECPTRQLTHLLPLLFRRKITTNFLTLHKWRKHVWIVSTKFKTYSYANCFGKMWQIWLYAKKYNGISMYNWRKMYKNLFYVCLWLYSVVYNVKDSLLLPKFWVSGSKIGKFKVDVTFL